MKLRPLSTGLRETLGDLAWLLPLGAVVRAVYLFQLHATPLARHLLVDEAGYHRWAQAIAEGDLVASGPFYQAPLYPYLLGIWYALFGESLLGVRLVHAALGLVSVGLLYGIGKRIFGRTAGRLTALAAALYAPFLFYEGQVLKSSAALVATNALVLLLLRASEGRRRARWLVAGLALGILILLRGNAFLYLPFLAVWILVRAPEGGAGTRAWGRRAGDVALLVAGTAMAIAPATLHNLAAGGGLVLTTYQGGSNFYIGNHPGALGVYAPFRPGREAPEFEGRDATEEASRRAGRELSPSEVSRFWFAEGLRFARERPGEFVRLQAAKLALTWNAREVPDTWDVEFVAGLVPLLGAPLPGFGWMAPLGLLGFGLAYPWRRAAGLLALLTLATTISVSVFYVFARYRLPLAPLVLLFAGHALAAGARAVRLRRWTPLAAGTVALLPLWALVHLGTERFGLVFTDEVGHQNLGFLHVEDGRPDLGEAEFARAVAVNADLGTAWLMLARLQAARGDAAAQADTLERLLDHTARRRSEGAEILDPAQEAEARLRLGQRWRDTGRLAEAAVLFRGAGNLLPDDPVPLIQLGITLRLGGDLAGAREAYREALIRDPGNPVVLVNFANVELDRGDARAAAAHLREAATHCAARSPDLCDEIVARLRGIEDRATP